MKKILLLTCIGIIMVAAGQAMAESKPIQLSLTPDIAIFDRNTEIAGLTLSIWGENPQKSMALGFANGSTGMSAGFSLGFILNYADSYKGVQWAPVNYTKANFIGWQAGIVNYTGGPMKGLQIGVVNYAEGPVKGLQTGVVNYAAHLTGLQLGLINYAAKATSGVQIGVINIIPQNQWFAEFPNELAPGMVIVNWRF